VNLGSANLVLRPRSTRESVDLTLLFLTRLGGRRYLHLAAGVLLPAWAACWGCQAWLQLDWAVVWLLALPLGVWLQGVFTLAAGDLMFQPTLQPRSVLRRLSSRLGDYSGGLLISRGFMAVSIVTVLLWPWAWCRFAFLPEALLLEGLSVGRASQRATRLNAGAFGAGLGHWCAMLACIAFSLLSAELLGRGVIQDVLQIEAPVGELAEDGGSAYALLGWFISVPIVSTLRFLRYIDVRTRVDAWDVQVRLQRAAQAALEAE